jgi:hypothetical protein
MKQSKNLLNGKRIPPIEKKLIGGVTISLMLDRRNYTKEDKSLIAVCVTYSYDRFYYTTGTTSSFDDYMSIVNCGRMGKWYEKKKELMPYFKYVEQLLISGGSTPITWSLESGNLPNGLNLSTAGVISGTPTTVGTSNFTVKATNGAGNDTKALSISIVAAPVAPTITTAANCEGSKTSSPTATVTKATQTAPPSPTLKEKTKNSITLNIVEGCEYQRDGGSWQTSNIFNGLTPNTSYTFKQRKTETATHLASPASASATFKTDDEVGIVENENGGVVVYPNPTTGELYFQTDEVIKRIEVFNIEGRKVMETELGDSKILNISHLQTGSYFLKVYQAIGTQTIKVVKQ